MDRSRGPGKSLPAEDRRTVPGQAGTGNNGSMPKGVGNPSLDTRGMIPRFESKNNQAELFNTGRMADQRTRHADKRHEGNRYRTRSKQFFAKGRVFSTASGDGDGLSNQNFLVIKEAQESPDDTGTYCTCLSVTSLRKDLDLSECGLLHVSSTQPPSIRGVKFKPLQVDIASDTRFDAPMLVDYIQLFNVDINSEVKDIGKLRSESTQDLMDNFKDSLFDSPQERDGRHNKHERRKGRGEDESSHKPPHEYREPRKPHSKAPTTSNAHSAPPNASSSSSVPNGVEATSRRPKLRNLEVLEDAKRQKPKGPSYNSDGLEDDPESPNRAREAENRRLKDARNNQRRGGPLPVDQLRGTKDRHERDNPTRRGEEGEMPKRSSRADMERGRGDERTGRPGISLLPHSPTKRNMNHRKDGGDISKDSTTGVPIPVPMGDSFDRSKQRDRNNPGAPRENTSSRKEDALEKNDNLRKDDGRPGDRRSRLQSPDREFNDGRQDYGSDWEENDPVDGRRDQKGRGAPQDARNPPPLAVRRDDPTDGTSRRGVPPNEIRGRPGDPRNERSIPGVDDRGRPLDRTGHDPRAMTTETSLPGRFRPNGLPGRDGKINPATGGRPPGRAPDPRSMSNYPPPSRSNGRDPQSNPGDRRQMRPPGYGAPDRSDPRSNNRRSISPRRAAPSASYSRPPGGGAPSRPQPPPSSRGRGPTGRGPPPSGDRGPSGRDGSPRRNLPPLNTPGDRSPSGGRSPMGGSSPMSRGSPGGGYAGGSSPIGGGSPMSGRSPMGGRSPMSSRSPMGGRSPMRGSSPVSRRPPGGRPPGGRSHMRGSSPTSRRPPGGRPPGGRPPGGRPPGGRLPMRGSSPMSRRPSGGGSPGPSSPMSGASSVMSPGGPPGGSPIDSPGGSSGSPGGSPMESPSRSPGSRPDSPMDSPTGSPTESGMESSIGSRRGSTESGSSVGSSQGQSPMGGSSYRSPLGSGPPSPAMSGRSRSLSPPPRERSQSGGYSSGPGSPRSPGSGARPGSGNEGVRRRGPKGKSRGLANKGQPPSSRANNEESYSANDDGCGCCENGFLAWWKSVADWWNGVGQEEWIQMEDQKNNGKQKSEPDKDPENEDSKSVASGADPGSPSSKKDPFEDGQDDESTAVGSDEENSGDDGTDSESEDESGSDQDGSDQDESDQEDSDADTRSNSDAESDQESEDEGELDNPSDAGSRRSSTAVASKIDNQDSVRHPADKNSQNPPEIDHPANENSYSANNQYMETPQDCYSYLPNDDRSYMGQHNYVPPNGHPNNPSDMPPQVLDSAYPAAHSAKSTVTAFPPIPEDAAELATDNSEPPNPPPYAPIPSTPQQLSRPRSTRFELACERDPVELEVPLTTTTRGKSELFLPPSLTPGVATAPHSAFSQFSARVGSRTPSPFHPPPMPQIQSSWAPPQQQQQFPPYQPQATLGPSQQQSQIQAQSQPQLRSGMNYVPQVPQAPPPTNPGAQRYDARGNQFHEQAIRQPSPHQQQIRGTPPPVLPARSEMRPPSFPPPLSSTRGVGGAGVTSGQDGRYTQGENEKRVGQDSRGKDSKSQGPNRGQQDPRNKGSSSRSQKKHYAESDSDSESGSDSESEPDSDSDNESESDDEYGYDRQRGMHEEIDSDDDSDIDSGFGTYDDDLLGREDDTQSNYGGPGLQGPTGIDPRAGMRNAQVPPPSMPAPAPEPVAAPAQAHMNARGVAELNYAAPNPYMGQHQMQMHMPPDQNQYQNRQPQIPEPAAVPNMQTQNPYQRPGEMPHNSHMPPQVPGYSQHSTPNDMYNYPYGRPEEQQRQQQQQQQQQKQQEQQEQPKQPKQPKQQKQHKQQQQQQPAPRAPQNPQQLADVPEKSQKHKPETQKSQPHKRVKESQKDVREEKRLKEKNNHVEKPLEKKSRRKEQPPVPMSPAESAYPQPSDDMSSSPSRRSPFEQENGQEEMREEDDSESESDSDDESEPEEDLESDPGSNDEESDEEEEEEEEEENYTRENEDREMESDTESLAPPSPSPVKEKKERKRRGEGDMSKGGRGTESGKGKERSRGGNQGGRGVRDGRERNGRGKDRRGRGREEGADVGGKLKKTWDFLKKLDYHEK